jgi:hypothetical protein
MRAHLFVCAWQLGVADKADLIRRIDAERGVSPALMLIILKGLARSHSFYCSAQHQIAPNPLSPYRLAHEYSLKHELDPAWAARPLELLNDAGRPMLLVEDMGSEPLDRQLGA